MQAPCFYYYGTTQMQRHILVQFSIEQIDCLEWVLSRWVVKTRLDAQQHSSCWQVLNSSLRASLFTQVANCECSTYVRIACYLCTRPFKQLLTVLPTLITSSYAGLKDLRIFCHQTTTSLTYQIHMRSHHVRWLMYNNLNYVWKQAKWKNKMLEWSLTDWWTTVTNTRRWPHMISPIN